MGKVFEISDKSEKNSTKTKKKTKKAKNTHTRVRFILDESGSMFSCWNSTVNGFNEYVDTLRNDSNGNTYDISLTKFEGGNIEHVFENVPVDQVEQLTTEMYRPAGGTNLNDAIGETVMRVARTTPRMPHNTLIIIMTDGYENMSKEWSSDKIAKLIQSKEKDGWTVTFLGANIDTVSVGKTYSIKRGNMKSYSTQNMDGTMRGLAAATTTFASTNIELQSCDSFFEGTDDWTEKSNQTNSVGDLGITTGYLDPSIKIKPVDWSTQQLSGHPNIDQMVKKHKEDKTDE